MLKYILKRVLFAFLALFILLALVFFLMQAIPGYPIPKDPKWTDAEYFEKLHAAGLTTLDGTPINPLVQFFHFIGGLFKGQWGQVFVGQYVGQSIPDILFGTPGNPGKLAYSMMIAGPAFILSSLIGISLGILAAYYRGKWVDTFINVIAVLFISVPSFIFALYLFKLGGLLGLGDGGNFVIPDGTNTGEVIESMIMPVLAMTLASISSVLYYTRNELVDVFKQDYIKTALSKGLTFRRIVFTHALRNAAIPIIACLLPNLIGVMSGSIIVETFFKVPGSSSILVNSIQTKEIYIVMFITMFYSLVYFLLEIVADILYTIIDPRIVFSSKSNTSTYKKVLAKINRASHWQAITSNKNLTYSVLINATTPTATYNQIQALKNINNEEIIEYKAPIVTKQSIAEIKETLPVQTQVGVQVTTLSNNAQAKVNEKLFTRAPLNKSASNEQIVGKPSTYWADVIKRFFKSKAALVATLIFLGICLFAIVVPLATPNATEAAIGPYGAIIGYLPPRLPGISSTNYLDKTVTISQLNTIVAAMCQKLGISTLPTGIEQITQFLQQHGVVKNILISPAGTYVLEGFNPYLLPGMENVYPIMGTDGQGRNWWDMMWYATAQSLVLSILAAGGSVIIGTIYGAISGAFAGKWVDTLMMRIVDILSGIPLIIWVLILSSLVSGGSMSLFTIAIALIVTTWMWPAVLARTYIMKYKDAEFVQAAYTLGASKTRIIFSHLLPNIIGRLAVTFVNKIPATIFFEVSLVFLALKPATDVSLGSMIDAAWKTYDYLLVGPTLTIVLITLSAQVMANNLNDAIDPRVSGD